MKIKKGIKILISGVGIFIIKKIDKNGYFSVENHPFIFHKSDIKAVLK